MSIGYFYDDEFKLAGSMSLQRNPRQTNEYLIPANCTTIAPPSNYDATEIPQFNTDTKTWSLVKSAYWYQLQESYSEARTLFGVPLYEQDSQGVWVERPIEDVNAEVAQFQAEADYAAAVSEAKRIMDENIIAKALEVTKGTTLESAQAFISAYQVRVNNAAEYINDGLIVRYELPSWPLNTSLDTEQKIKDYYNALLVYIDKYRESEINTYVATVSALVQP